MAQDPWEQERARQVGQIVARAWSDEAFKQRLLADPAPVLAELGIAVPAGVTIVIHETTPAVAHLVLPAPPSDKLDLEQLEQVSGGATGSFYCGKGF